MVFEHIVGHFIINSPNPERTWNSLGATLFLVGAPGKGEDREGVLFLKTCQQKRKQKASPGIAHCLRSSSRNGSIALGTSAKKLRLFHK